jgi:hypothetical protein
LYQRSWQREQQYNRSKPPSDPPKWVRTVGDFVGTDEFRTLLEKARLNAGGVSCDFVQKMILSFSHFGPNTFLSPKQLSWLEDLAGARLKEEAVPLTSSIYKSPGRSRRSAVLRRNRELQELNKLTSTKPTDALQRRYLWSVSLLDQEEVKKLGGKLNPFIKRWYVPTTVPMSKLTRWSPERFR